MTFLAIDPGLRCTGWAEFRKGGLYACGFVVNPTGTAADMAQV